MSKLSTLILIILSWIPMIADTSASSLPYTDVNPRDPYARAVQTLYDGGVISDDGSHLFRPEALMTRDFYVSLSVGIGCRRCETPSPEDIIRYSISPFVDLPKTNPYYYCIAYGNDTGIIRGYSLDSTGRSVCENGSSYSTSPFCPENTISRIEAAAILLRRAKLWDDTLNLTTSTTSSTISDVSSYWYGYAQKGIELGILRLKPNGTLGADEKINRGEFAMMAAGTLGYMQCRDLHPSSSLTSRIDILDRSGQSISGGKLISGGDWMLGGVTTTGSGWTYEWTAQSTTTTESLSGSGRYLSGSVFGTGSWSVELRIIDPNTRTQVSVSTTTISVVDPAVSTTDPVSRSGSLSVSLMSSGLVFPTGGPVQITPIVSDTGHPLIYNWDYGDGTRSSLSGTTTHTYTDPGYSTITLTVTDIVTGETAQSSIVIQSDGERDTDGDGVTDSQDTCPRVRGSRPTGCPIIDTYDLYTRLIGGESISSTSGGPTDTGSGRISIIDASGNTLNTRDFGTTERFDLVALTESGSGSYLWTITDPSTGETLTGTGRVFSGSLLHTGNWGVTLEIRDITGKILSTSYERIRVGDTSGGITGGTSSITSCLASQLTTRGLLIGKAVCDVCPCPNQISISSKLRSCDIVFPTILSPTLDTLYSRGDFFTIP